MPLPFPLEVTSADLDKERSVASRMGLDPKEEWAEIRPTYADGYRDPKVLRSCAFCFFFILCDFLLPLIMADLSSGSQGRDRKRLHCTGHASTVPPPHGEANYRVNRDPD